MASRSEELRFGIRLEKEGKKGSSYRIVVTDQGRSGKFVERIGSYNPLVDSGSTHAKLDAEQVRLDTDRVRHWLAIGAQPTDRVRRFLNAAGLVKKGGTRKPSDAIVLAPPESMKMDESARLFEQLARDWTEFDKRRRAFRARLRAEVKRGEKMLAKLA